MCGKLATHKYLSGILKGMEIIARETDNLGVERNLFGKPAIAITKTKITNKRQYILSLFVEEINNERKGTKWKPIYPKVVALKTAHLKVPDLEHFYSTCLDYKNRKGSFSRCFFGALKDISQ